MISKIVCLIFSIGIFSNAYSSECALYEKSHPAFLLNGSHLSTTKCSTCSSCHIHGIFTGTPKSCVICHNGDPSRLTIGRSTKHIPTQLVECSYCHNTTAFTTLIGTQSTHHAAVITLRCDSCHIKAYSAYGVEYKPSDHPTTTTIGGIRISIVSPPMDCGASSNCHSSSRSSFSK